jgi:hypothetical protein
MAALRPLKKRLVVIWHCLSAAVRRHVNYILSNAATSAQVTRPEAGSEFAAIEWSRAWLAQNADHDAYLLVRADGTPVADFVRTVAGQWYAIGKFGAARGGSA